MKKLLCTMMAVLCVGALVFAAGGKDQSAAGGKTKIILWHSMGGRNGEALEKLAKEFNSSQEKIEIELQYQGNYDDCIVKIKATPKGQGPDILQLYDIGTRWAIDSGTTLKMQDFINRDKYNISDYEPNILAYYTLDGELFSMPFNCSSPVIIYNKEALAAAKLDPKTAFATMDAVLATSKALAASNPNMHGSFTNYSWVFEQLVSIQDKDLLDNGNGRKSRATAVIAREPLLNIMTKLRAIYSDPSNVIFGKGTAESKNQFATGSTLGYIIDSCSIYADSAAAAGGKFNLGFASIPKVNAGDTGGVSVGGGSLWLMDSGSDQKANAAWEFVKFVTGAEKQAQWSMETGYLPIRRSSVDLPVYQDFTKNTNPELIVAIEALRNSKPSCAGSVMGVFSKARVIIENEIETMANNPSVTPQAVVDRIISQINEEITLYNRTN
ncbi:glycerol-3-phosphate ABC transporter substarate-binding protein [Treponema primitia ZAS-2]|uniref:sn-glycerol-3-phosphate-binding periplasmic protein UgpB n=1 Tax=Treponema primitia (strain ATCC BAA-887 / DSM 12427 / ZAS-2) TaxID=545694 RepID=F5YK89_TREPZ|nr:ABC transporter substrate-binding protein [Treponema primitia]AEF85646.1 glycerol-3-phosphate ABC transporter substarate-binding protein [Treponema primitia ZAS-2]